MNVREPSPENEVLWQAWLTRGRPPRRLAYAVFRRILARFPGSPRCKLCSRPLGGSGKMLALLGFGASRKNPAFCGYCLERLPLGGAQVEIAVLFADVRGSTSLAEGSTPLAFTGLMNRFYAAATAPLLSHGALIDKLVGDEVVALFIPGGPSYRGLAARAGAALLQAVGYGTSGRGFRSASASTQGRRSSATSAHTGSRTSPRSATP